VLRLTPSVWQIVTPRQPQWLISNPQQVFPLAKFSLKAHALGDVEARDDARLDLLAGLSGGFAGSSILSA
jgi:hypothetical protein